MMRGFPLPLLLLVAGLGVARAAVDTSVILKPLLVGYDKQSRPYLDDDQPVVVEAQYRVNRLFSIDSVSNTYMLDTFFRLRWHDPRLAYGGAHFNSSYQRELRVKESQIWVPDIIIFNSLNTQVSASSVAVFPDGTVFWSRLMLLNLTCKLDLHDFPFDVNELPLTAVSFSYGIPELILIPFNNTKLLNPDPVPTFTSTIFTMLSTRFVTRNGTSLPAEQPVMQLEALFRLQRQQRPYILKYVAPMGFLVFLSTLSYFIDPKSPPARVAAAVLLVLAALSFNLSVGKELPKLDYITLIDWFVIGCFLTSVATVFEYSAVNCLVYHSDKRYHPVGFGIDDFFRSTMPILWLLVFLLCLFYIDQKATQIAVGVMVCAWAAWLIAYIVVLVRRSFYKKTD